MSNLHIQASFNSGEWSPSLYARVDVAKYRSGAALLQNYFVDYRGGASTRTGSRYIIQAYKSSTAVRIIPFQASFNVGYVLEFGDKYIRFFINGAPILEPSFNLAGATQANPCVLNIPGNNFIAGDWIYISSVVGMTQLNGRYFSVASASGANVTINNLNGVPIDSTGYSAYISGGTASRIYTITSPYAAADLALIKFTQNVSQMIICHPNYQPYILTLITATNWSLLPIVFGSTSSPPTIFTYSTSLVSGSVSYAYVLTTVDANGQESVASLPLNILNLQDIRTTPGTIQILWSSVAGAISYNIYKANVSYLGTVPAGVPLGFIGSATSSPFIDSNIAPDFTQTPPVAKNPFQGKGVNYVTVTAAGVYTTVPTVSFTGATSTIAASAVAVLQVQGTPTVGAGGSGYAVDDTILFTNNVILIVNAVSSGVITSFKVITTLGSSPGAVTSGGTPANPVAQISTSGSGTGATANLVWGVGQVQVLNSGAGYTSVPTVTFSAGSATATAVLTASSNGYPSVPGFFQQRLVLAGPIGSPQTFYMSRSGAYFNYNVSAISQASDAITGTLVSGQLNTIKSMISQTSGLLILSDKASWLINGGSNGSAVSPSALVANAQSFIGTNDVPPIVINYDVLYVQSKGAAIRDSAYNIYANVFTGTDISILASHLFYGFEILEWAWAEEPFKLVYAIRSDGTLLNLTFLKEQDFIGWAHSITQGLYKSTCTVTELTTNAGEVDAAYVVVQRVVNGFTVQYIERFAERAFPNGVVDANTVDAFLAYSGTPTTTFSGAEHLAGLTVTGLADGVPITPFVMPVSGAFTLPSAASKVTIGLAYTCDLQTLAIDIGDPTIQGKLKTITHVDVRVASTLGLQIGSSFSALTPMKDLIRGNVSSMLTGQPTQIITDLTTGDARTFIDSTYTVPGQYAIRQSLPYPATILGVIPNLVVGDGDGRPR